MSPKTADLRKKIQCLEKQTPSPDSPPTSGYGVSLMILTDLFSCIFIGLGVGLFFQKIFHASVLLTATFVLLGGIAGLWTMIRFALNQSKGDRK